MRVVRIFRRRVEFTGSFFAVEANYLIYHLTLVYALARLCDDPPWLLASLPTRFCSLATIPPDTTTI